MHPGIISTVLKFHDFSVTQILREIIFGEFINSKSDILAALNFVNLII